MAGNDQFRRIGPGGYPIPPVIIFCARCEAPKIKQQMVRETWGPYAGQYVCTATCFDGVPPPEPVIGPDKIGSAYDD